MADKGKSLMLALGVDPETGEYKKGANENLLGDLAEETKKTIGEEFDQFKEETKKSVNEDVKKKLPVLTQLKGASEKSGGNLTSEAALSLMRTIGSTVTTLTQDAEKAVIKSMGSVEVNLKQTLDLLSSNQEVKQDEALDKIERLQKAFGTDFNKIVEAMGANTRDLIAARQFTREDNRKKAELIEREKEKQIEVRNELRERGINTYLDKETNTLKLITLKDEKAFRKEIISEEKRLKQLEKEYLFEEKKLKNQEVITGEQQKEFNNKRLLILDLEKDINKKKEEANIKPDEKFDGFFSQTYGAAIDSAKNTFGELQNGVKSVIKGFKNLPSSIGNFAKGIGRAALSVGAFAVKGLLIGLVIGAVIYGLYKLYQAFQKAKDFVSNLFSFGKKKEEGADTSQDALAGQIAKGDTINNNSDNKSSTSTSTSTTAGDIKNSTSIENQATDTSPLATTESLLPLPKSPIKPIPRLLNVNKMSTDMAAEKESKPGNIISAPSSSNNVVSNTVNQSMSMIPSNPDRSFINLNTVPV
jgi:hypothetical protein